MEAIIKVINNNFWLKEIKTIQLSKLCVLSKLERPLTSLGALSTLMGLTVEKGK